MPTVNKEMALHYHEDGRPGKIEIVPTKPYASQTDLALAYSPGVAFPCIEIEKNPEDAYKYTGKGNLVGVISNGTAVLGLGDIGALAGKPVMEGKALLFKIFAGLDAFDIEINEKDPEKMIQIVKALTPTFGGINLEDIKAPECFEIEKRLKEECEIPIMHDDQHGTAIISAAGLINALKIQGKKIGDIKLVVNGAGAAAISCTRLYVKLGVRKENVVMCDSKGVIRADREKLEGGKKEFATKRDLHTLKEALVGADVFLGLSKGNVVTPEMVKTMAPRPIVFALANPDPEISYEEAVNSREDVIVATGRSDYPNQINNVIGFPYIFRGALDCQANAINEEMKIAAVYAIAELATKPVPAVVDEAYGRNNIKFGRDYILPKPLDPRLLLCVAPAVAKAAFDSGIAKKPIQDWEKYQEKLHALMGDDGKMIRRLVDLAKEEHCKLVISDGNNDNMLRTAVRLATDGVCEPIVLGNQEMIEKRASRLGLDISAVKIINPRHDDQEERRKQYATILANKKGRAGYTFELALDKMYDRSYFATMMVEAGDADATVIATYSSAETLGADVVAVIGLQDGFTHFATMHILNTRKGSYFIADTAVNPDADTRALVEITRLAEKTVRFFANEPVMALLSYSNFGSSQKKEAKTVSDAVKELHEKYPNFLVDGEMQVDYALNTQLRDRQYPFNKLQGKKVNTLIFPNLTAANATGKLLLEMGIGSIIGPIQMGLNKPVYFTRGNATPSEIYDIATIASVEAIVTKGKKS